MSSVGCTSADSFQDGAGRFLRGGVAAEVAGAQPLFEGAIDRRSYGGRLGLARETVAEQERRREDRGQRVGGVGARYVGRAAVDGLEDAGPAGLSERGAGEHPDR